MLYDRLFDLTADRSGFGLEHLQRLAPAYLRADPTYPCRTASVTHAPNFGLWAASMGSRFNGRLDPDVDMIGKPFSYGDLAAKVREVLDRKPPT